MIHATRAGLRQGELYKARSKSLVPGASTQSGGDLLIRRTTKRYQ